MARDVRERGDVSIRKVWGRFSSKGRNRITQWERKSDASHNKGNRMHFRSQRMGNNDGKSDRTCVLC